MKLVTPLVLALSLSVAVPLSAQEQSRSLEDIRKEIESLSSQITGLRSELVATTAASGTTTSGSPLLRLDAIEGELRSLTGQVEELRFRIDQVVKDGTNRIGDLEFRLTELEGGDPSTLGQTRTLGGEQSGTEAATNVEELTVTEEADFKAAIKDFEAGDFSAAADKLASFEQTYPASPMTADAQYFRGLSLAQLEDWKSAGRSFLNSFSSRPEGETSPDALYWLGFSLGRLQKVEQACQTLKEVPARFAGHEAANSAVTEMQNLGCS